MTQISASSQPLSVCYNTTHATVLRTTITWQVSLDENEFYISRDETYKMNEKYYKYLFVFVNSAIIFGILFYGRISVSQGAFLLGGLKAGLLTLMGDPSWLQWINFFIGLISYDRRLHSFFHTITTTSNVLKDPFFVTWTSSSSTRFQKSKEFNLNALMISEKKIIYYYPW